MRTILSIFVRAPQRAAGLRRSGRYGPLHCTITKKCKLRFFKALKKQALTPLFLSLPNHACNSLRRSVGNLFNMRTILSIFVRALQRAAGLRRSGPYCTIMKIMQTALLQGFEEAGTDPALLQPAQPRMQLAAAVRGVFVQHTDDHFHICESSSASSWYANNRVAPFVEATVSTVHTMDICLK